MLPSSYAMSDTFFDATKITKDKTYFDAVIRGLLTQPSQSVDQHVDDELWNKLFKYYIKTEQRANYNMCVLGKTIHLFIDYLEMSLGTTWWL